MGDEDWLRLWRNVFPMWCDPGRRGKGDWLGRKEPSVGLRVDEALLVACPSLPFQASISVVQPDTRQGTLVYFTFRTRVEVKLNTITISIPRRDAGHLKFLILRSFSALRSQKKHLRQYCITSQIQKVKALDTCNQWIHPSYPPMHAWKASP